MLQRLLSLGRYAPILDAVDETIRLRNLPPSLAVEKIRNVIQNSFVKKSDYASWLIRFRDHSVLLVISRDPER